MAPRPIRIEPAEKPPFRAPEDSDGLVVTHILELPLDLRPPPGREVNGRGLSGHPDENWIREALIKAVA